MKNKKILLISLFLTVLCIGTLSADGHFYGDLTWSPQISDYIWMPSSPDNHTLKRSFLSFNLTTDYVFANGIGVGQEIQWGMIDRITIKSGDFKYVIDTCFGSDYYVRFSPQFLYVPLQTGTHMITLGIGPSTTLYYLLSEYGDSFGELTTGLTLKMRYRWFGNDYLYFTAGIGVSVDFLSYGQFVEKIFSDFVQIQVSPVLGAGVRF